MKIYLAHGRGGSQHSKEIFHLARTAKRAGHTTHCINDTDSEDPELRSARLTWRFWVWGCRGVVLCCVLLPIARRTKLCALLFLQQP